MPTPAKFCLAFALSYMVASVFGAEAQAPEPPAELPPLTYRAKVFEYPADKSDPQVTETWRRPQEVEFVLITFCGGGGGGGAGTEQGGEYPGGIHRGGGAGGGAARATTLLIGPLSADVYTVKVGRAGNGGAATLNDGRRYFAPGEAGQPSSFEGPDTITAYGQGGTGGRGGQGPNGSDGEPGPFGLGGKGGAANGSGESTTSRCAGGGGSGMSNGPRELNGGAGGHGRVVIYPLPDLQRLFDVLGKLDPAAMPTAAPPPAAR